MTRPAMRFVRQVLAVLLGAVVASVVLFLVGMIANAINPTPPELMDPATPEAVARRVDATSTGTWLTVILGLALGAFAGGAIGAKVARTGITKVTTAIGAVLSLWAFYTFYVVFPAVLWVPALMLIAVLLFSYLGGALVTRSQRERSAPAKSE